MDGNCKWPLLTADVVVEFEEDSVTEIGVSKACCWLVVLATKESGGSEGEDEAEVDAEVEEVVLVDVREDVLPVGGFER